MGSPASGKSKENVLIGVKQLLNRNVWKNGVGSLVDCKSECLRKCNKWSTTQDIFKKFFEFIVHWTLNKKMNWDFMMTL